MENVSQTLDERKTGEEDKFIVYFLYDDEDQSVLVEEFDEIDFLEVIQHLNSGGSVFIAYRRKPERLDSSKTSLRNNLEGSDEPSYRDRI